MKDINFLLALVLCSFVVAFSGCTNDESGFVEKLKINGYVEKGPFISGSKVTIYELDSELNATGKTFETTTNNVGYFELNNAKFASGYVKFSANGHFFNEVTGKLSEIPITLEAIADISQNDNVNINLLTHLEMERVLKLFREDKKDFATAKNQARKELLACFNIDKSIVTENAGITNNDMSADILIAVSSILLHIQPEALLIELLNNFVNDLKNTGSVRHEISQFIKEASYRLDYVNVKTNIINCYSELGINDVHVGNFHYFIDGDGDGQMGKDFDFYPITIIYPESIFGNERIFMAYLAAAHDALFDLIIKNYFIFEALFTQSIEMNGFIGNNYWEIYNHQISPLSNFVGNLFGSSYQSIRRYNIVIENANQSDFYKFGHIAKIYRAYIYWIMTELWGDVPLILSAGAIDDYDLLVQNMKRTAKSVILEQLIDDLTNAVSFLEGEHNEEAYFAEALLARIFQSKGDYANAGDIAVKIIQSNRYQLASPQAKAFEPNNAESIISIDVSAIVDNSPFFQYISKGDAIPLIRYAEILLIAAESSFRQNNTQQAAHYINMLRVRNDREKIADDSDSDIVMTALLDEWKMEFNREGLWFCTLKRFGLSESILGIPSYMNLLPIPEIEIRKYYPEMTQNPGY